ncbi:MAG TPA: EAL domain-containing protein [Gammaproteobacteria bacterium]|nr:EAL domain-containing protein [Gammaproteobacteria bacterium]
MLPEDRSRQAPDAADHQALARAQLRREAQALAVLENIHDAIITLDADHAIIDLNRAAHRMLGYEDAEVLGQPVQRLLPDLTPDACAPAAGEELEMTARRRSGDTFDAAVGLSRVHSDQGTFTVLILRDLTERKNAQESLHREKEFAQITLQSIQEAVITTDARGRVNSANRAACTLLRRDTGELMERPLGDLLRFSGLEHRRAMRHALRATLADGTSHELSGQPEIRFDNGDSIYVNGRIAPLRAADGTIIGSVVVLQDVTAEKRMREILSWQATHDDLTSLINRREFERRLQQLIEQRVGDTRHVLLYLDLDQFKLINDNCGHDAGDHMLRQLTSRLGTRLRNTDTLARLGGDEFAALLPHCSVENGRRIAEDLRELVRNFRFEWNGRTFGVGVSIGLVCLDEQILSITDALTAADSACYIAKENGRDQVVIYRPSGDEEQRRREEMSQTALIREALEQDRFCLWAQPIMPIEPGADDWGIEILVRMLDENGGTIAPGAFIPGAERYNLMSHIDRWVLRALCRHWQAQPRLFERLDKIAVNLSGQSVANDEFLDFVIAQVEDNGLPWGRLCFEITETAAVSSIEKARHFIETLRERGARFALDDFGSGLSSFAYLKQLPVDYLKIDGAFVKDMEHDRIDAAMVRSIAEIGRAMQLRSIAEFVENERVVALLREARVDYAQGYGICRPMPLEALAGFRPLRRAEAG